MNKIVKLVIGWVAFMFSFITGFIALSTVSNDTAYMMILLSNKVVRHVKNYKFNSTNSKDHSAVTSGTGLDLLLIDQLDAGYCKEMLTLFRKSAAGELDVHAAHFSVTAFCGIQANETGFYTGTHLLKSYLPIENKEVIWKKSWKGISASNMCLSKIDSGVYNQGLPNNSIDGSGGVTVFQFDPAMPSSTATKSNMDGATNSSRKGGDDKFLPDILTAVNNHFGTATDAAKISSLISNQDTDLIASYASLQHNRGSGGAIQYTMGIPYGKSYSTYVNITDSTANDLLTYAGYLCKLLTDFRTNVLVNDSSIDPDICINSSSARYAAVFMAANASDWYISSYAVEKFSDNTGVSIWNKMYPGNTVKNASELKATLNKSCMKFSAAIKQSTGAAITDDDISKVYGSDGTGDDHSPMGGSTWNKCGSIFHVSKTTSSMYKNKYSNGNTPYVISCYDSINAGHNVSTVIGGSYVYAYMLNLGGLTSVDPTNPETYYKSLQVEDTFSVPTDTSWMTAYNVDTSKLTDDRINVLTTAYNMTKVGCKYEQNGTVMDREFDKKYIPTLLDCSGFVSKVFNNTGFTNINYRHYTGAIAKQDVFECISKNDVKPGDIFCSDGTKNAHTVIYLSGTIKDSPGNLMVIHSTKNSGQNGPAVKLYSNGSYRKLTTSTTPKAGDTFYAYKIKGIDTGKYKTSAWTKAGKKYYGK